MFKSSRRQRVDKNKRSIKKSFFAAFFFCLLLLTGYFLKLKFDKNGAYISRPLVVFVKQQPNSLDPMQFDYTHLQPLQSISNIKLFSNFGDSQIRPNLAKEWKALNGSKEWKIKIRNDITFFGGKKVTANLVVKSLTRIALLCKQSGSKNGFVEFLQDIDKLKSIDSTRFLGIEEKGESEIVIRFSRPVENVLELLSFGLYAVVDDENFDLKTGKWKDISLEKYSGAGPYKIASIDEGKVSLSLRNDYPADMLHLHASKKIKIIFNLKDFNETDIFVGASDAQKPPGQFSFHGGGVTSILYFSCNPWKLKSSPFSKIGLRRSIRDAFERKFEEAGYEVPDSFFPLVMKGIGKFQRKKVESERSYRPSVAEVSFLDLRPRSDKLMDVAIDSLEGAVKELGAAARPVKDLPGMTVFQNVDPDRKKYDMDIAAFITEISIIDPMQDVKLMFSKNGINLPDTSGEIRKELDKDSFSPQVINQLIYNQAVIWPYAHRARGVWARSNLDLSRYNSALLLGDLQWIGN